MFDPRENERRSPDGSNTSHSGVADLQFDDLSSPKYTYQDRAEYLKAIDRHNQLLEILPYSTDLSGALWNTRCFIFYRPEGYISWVHEPTKYNLLVGKI